MTVGEVGGTSEATDVIVPHAEKPKVDLKEVQQRVREELSQFKQGLQEADDPILAAQILTESEARIQVTYHDLSTIKDIPGWDKLTLEEQLRAAYGQSDTHAWDEAAKGKQIFSIQDGIIRNISKDEPELSSAADFNAVLQGLADQHSSLLQQRLATSAAGVTVPAITK